MAVDRDDVRHIAALARLAVDEARVETLTRELQQILAHMDVLQGVRSEDVDPAIGVGASGMPLRRDEGPPYPMDRPITALAPLARDGFLLVPRLATHEGAGAADVADEVEP